MAFALGSKGGLDVIQHIGAIGRSLYGTCERYKCVVDGEASVHMSCMAEILQNVDVEHPVGHLMNDLVQNHHVTYGCGTRMLVVVAGLLAETASNLREQGLDEHTIVEGLHQAVELCIRCLPALPLESLFKDKGAGEVLTDPSDKVRKLPVEVTTAEKNSITSSSMETPLPWQHNEMDDGRSHATDIAVILNSHIKGRSPMVKLEMKTLKDKRPDGLLQRSDNDGDDEDIDWYFSDDKDLLFEPTWNPTNPLIVPLSASEQHSSLNETRQSTSCHTESLIGERQETIFSSLADKSDIDDFEGCFDNDFMISMKPALKNDVDRSNIEARGIGDQDEFEECFDDAEYKVEDSRTKVSLCESQSEEIATKMNMYHDTNISIFNEHVEKKSERSCDQSSDITDLNGKIQDILQRKTKALSVGVIGNLSRHFKTLHSTVEALKGQVPVIQDLNVESLSNGSIKRAAKFAANVSEKPVQIRVNNAEVSEASSSEGSLHVLNSHSPGMCNMVDSKMKQGIKGAPSRFTDAPANRGCSIECNSLAIEEALKETLSKRPKVQLSLLQQGSRHFRSIDGCLKKMEESRVIPGTESRIISTDVIGQGVGVKDQDVSGNVISQHMNPKVRDERPSPKLTCQDVEIRKKQDNVSGIRDNEERCNFTHLDSVLCTEEKRHWFDGFKSKPLSSVKIVTKRDLLSVVDGLSRGDMPITEMVTGIAWKQQKTEQYNGEDFVPLQQFSFDVNRVHTLLLPGLSSQRSGVVDGLVTKVSPDFLHLIQGLQRKRRAVLINGDVSATFQHQGMNHKIDSTFISQKPSELTVQQRWLDNILDTLEKLSISALFVKGHVTSSVQDMCRARDIIVVSHMSTRGLIALAEATNTEMAAYVTECTEVNVAREVQITLWTSDWTDQIKWVSNQSYVVITPADRQIQTAIFCHPVCDMAAATEERLLHVAHRFSNVLECTRVVKGGMELQIAEHLCCTAENLKRKISDAPPDVDTTLLLPLILESLSSSFCALKSAATLNSTVNKLYSHNSINDDQRSRVCITLDDYTSTVEAFRSAEHLVCQVLLTDMEIITGLRKDSAHTCDDLIGML